MGRHKSFNATKNILNEIALEVKSDTIVQGDSMEDDINTNIDTSINTTPHTEDDTTPHTTLDTTIGTESKFVIKKKSEERVGKKAFNVYMSESMVKKLDRLGKKTGYSRNELINMMCEKCLDNIQIEE